MKKTFLLAVSDFALPTPRKGSIDTYSGFSLGSQLGVEIHKEIQQARCRDIPSYEAEVYCSHSFTYQKYTFEVLGKIDGLVRQPELKIEEIKTGFDLQKLKRYLENHREDHPYCLQLRTYGYIYWLRKGVIPSLNLLLVSSRNKKMVDFPLELDVPAYESWLDRRLTELANEVDAARKRSKKRKTISGKMTFPFVQARPGQKELIETVSMGMQQKKHLMLQAPTGLGKTIGILYPALQESLARGQKVIYLTPKNSQHLIAVDAIKRLQNNGTKIKSLTITAKKKICMKHEPLCNAEYCEFAENHYTKITENNVIDLLKKEKRLQSHNFRQAAETFQVCPYELQMDLVPHVEAVICDYNYVFSPRAAGSRVAKLQLGEEEKPNVVIDEAHNLPARAMDYYSPALAVSIFEKVGRSMEVIPKKLIPLFHTLIKECIEIIYRQADKNKKGPHFITPIVKDFTAQEAELRDFLSIYLESDVTIGPNDIVLGIYNYWADFTAALEWVSENAQVFFTSFIPDPPLIKLTCCDASDMLKACYNEFEQVVGFSATLKPFAYYSQLSGLASKKLKMEEFVSPFPRQRRKLLLIPQISSKYSERHSQRNGATEFLEYL